MSKVIKIKRGLDIELVGKADKTLSSQVTNPTVFAISPDDFHGIPPKLAVKDGVSIKAGTVLFYDKNNPDIKFVSPVSGTVAEVVRGNKRKIMQIAIQADAQIAYEQFGEKNAENLSASDIKQHLLDTGLWPLIKQRPYDVIANPSDTPRDIFISGFDSAPLAPDMDFVLKGEEKNFQTGLDVLSKLTEGKVYLGISTKTTSPALTQAKNVEINTFDGPHPAGNVGTQIHHIKPINQGEIIWTIHPADVIIIGRLFNQGITDFSRIVAITGSEALNRHYIKLLPGASIKDCIKTADNRNKRFISGNVLTGKHITSDGFLGYYDHQITVIPEGDDKNDIFGWISPGFTKYSVNRSFASWFIRKLNPKKQFVFDARIKGGKRAIIMSNEYDKVFPMDVLPEFLIKATLAFDIEKMEQLGVYEVAPEDFALCEFVDTSKLEIQQIMREGLDKLKTEMT